jgi:hypothetical protein
VVLLLAALERERTGVLGSETGEYDHPGV